MITLQHERVTQLVSIADDTVGYIGRDDDIGKPTHGFVQEAQANGFIKLGSGHFSQAWTHPDVKDYVIKVGFKKEDSGSAYAAWCRANQGLAGVPVIYGIERYNKCYVVLMDKLIDFARVARITNAKSSYFNKTGRELFGSRIVDEYREVSRAVHEGIRIVGSDRYINYCHFSHSLTPIIKTANEIHEFFKGIAKFDLHEENVMLNKFGKLVIIDPVSFTINNNAINIKVDEVGQIRKPFRVSGIPRNDN